MKPAAANAAPTAALLIIGAEILAAKVVDENGPYMLRALRAHGVQVNEIRVVGDHIAHIAAAVQQLSPTHTVLFTAGGIGPTHDDVTMAALSQAFAQPLRLHAELLAWFTARLGTPLNAAQQKLAKVPAHASLLSDAALGVHVVQVANVFVLPGVPQLLRACFTTCLAQTPALQGTPFVSQALLLQVAESRIAAVLTQVQQAYPQLSLGSYPRFEAQAPYRVKITVDGRDAALVAQCMAQLCARLEPLVGAVQPELPHA